ncbi:ATP-binding protein [Catenovulum adriaticum]|uniref:histidine kinase n=1 Tax=Catenovulum adriaticum TaxID=2984846 RepID=A0ABY7AU83_9ALTE|nr:ATP-binding protein [Catenovulum sp. TS8]WAJ71929.1 ATP-binding protein [Catenovulum sp. TS8]
MSVLRTFHDIVTDQTLSFQNKAQSLLDFGLKVFDLDIGIISCIQNNIYTVDFVACHNNELAVGAQFPLDNTYCVHTLTAKKALAFHRAGKSTIATHPCYQNFKLESYIGAPININERTIGTVNFSSTEPSSPFSTEYIDYIELFAQWLGSEIARNNSIQQLEKNNQTLQKLEKAAQIGTWELELSSNSLYWSEQTKVIHEVSEQYEPKLDNALDFYTTSSTRNQIEQAVEIAVNSGEPWNLDLEITTAKNKQIWVSTQGNAEFENGQCIRLFGTVQNITDSIKMKHLLEAQKLEAEMMLSERSKLFSKISHELRTPLNGIIGMLNAAAYEQNKTQMQEKIKVALRSSDLLLCIINEVLDYSKITHGELTLEPSHFLLETIFTDLISLFTPLCQSKSSKLIADINIPKEIPAYFDSTRLNQIVSNLLSNAIKFTDKGEVTLTASARQVADNINLTFSVKDTGIGMTPETQNALFKPFSQGASLITQKYGGTGLGLSIVKELVGMMQGNVSVSSEFGVGSEFTVNLTIPLGKVNLTPEPSAELEDIDASSMNILVVDDNEINRIVMIACLQRFNVIPDSALDGEDAVERCKAKKYDLIFMDCIMPIMDGWQATQKIRADKLVPDSTIIAALTANTSESDKQACRQAGMNLFLTKPINVASVHDALCKTLNESPLKLTCS